MRGNRFVYISGFRMGRNGNPLQYSCLVNSMDRGAGQVQSVGSQKNWTRLSTHMQTFKTFTNHMSFLGKLLKEVLHTMEGEPKETYHLENRNFNIGRQIKFRDRSCVLDPMMVMHVCSVIFDSVRLTPWPLAH